MNRKRIATLVFCFISIFVLTACTSKASKSVIDLINQIGKVTPQSIENVEKAQRAYDALSEKDKSTVSNYNVLLDANEAIVGIELSNEIAKFSEGNIKADDFDTLSELFAEYNSLSLAAKKYVTNYDVLQDTFAQSVVLKVKTYKNTETDTALNLTKQYADILTDEQRFECLASIGRWGSLKPAEKYLKKHLKSPKSYSFIGGSISEPEISFDADTFRQYKVVVSIDFSVSNAFGGEIRRSIDLEQLISISLKDNEIHYNSTKAKGPESVFIALGEDIYYK